MIKKNNSNFIFKLGSYGLSKQLQNNEKLSNTSGTLFYMSPEVFNGEKYNEKTDLWSLGIVIYSLLFKKFPFPGGTSSPSEIYKQIIESRLENLQKTDNSDLNDLITKLLTIDQNKRISWNDYFKHPFFSNNNRNQIDINNLIQKLKEEKNKNSKLKEKINQLMFELNEEKNKNKILEEKLKKYENETSIEKKINKESLWINNLLDKDKEIKELKQKLSRFPFELNEGERLMTVTFKSFDQKIPHFSVICKNTDIFNQIEKQVYEEYKNYYDSDNYFVANGMRVQKYKSLDENKIRDHDVIMLYALNLDNI
jgi:serine/threonine protein kinase